MGFQDAAKGGMILVFCVILGCSSTSQPPNDLTLRASELRRQLAEARPPKKSEAVIPEEPFDQEDQEYSQPLAFTRLSRPAEKPEVIDEEDEEHETSREVLASSAHEVMTWYQLGMSQKESGAFEKAISAFETFLKQAPEHVYADRAQFWIAYCHFRNREYALAIVASNRLVTRYPYSLRVPEALYQMALSHLSMKQADAAKRLIRDLLREFPTHALSAIASKKLAEISKSERG